MNGTKLAKKSWIFAALFLCLAGCSAGSKIEARAPDSVGSAPGSAHASPAFASESQGESPASANAPPPAPPPASSPSKKSGAPSQPGADARGAQRSRTADSTPAPEPQSRPGLGTEFGEARTSRVHDVAFVRDGGRPFAIAALNYNDRKGVDALASVAARRDSARSVATGGGAVTISVRDSNGEALEAVHVGSRTFVVGQAGQRYAIVLQNHTGHRFEAVGTVDGLDIINGKPGTFENRGYVLLPFATLEIEGFRTSAAQVAAFRFATVADSYAAQTGSARNVGVIGLAFFSERGDALVPENETRLRDTASPFPADPRFAQPPSR